MTRLPDQLDPETLRWVAEQLSAEAVYAENIAQPQRSSSLRAKCRWLRHIASRIESRRIHG